MKQKIALLGLGLAMGLILLAKVYFDNSFDNYINNSSKVFQVVQQISATEQQERGLAFNPGTYGALAAAIKEEIPQVEYVSRCFAHGFGPADVSDLKGNTFTGGIPIFADTSFFHIFTRKIYAGNHVNALNQKEGVIISMSLAKRMSGNKQNPQDLIGATINWEPGNRGHQHRVEAIFEDFPNNSQFRDVAAIFPISALYEHFRIGSDELSNSWNDNRYHNFVKLKTAQSKSECEEMITQLYRKNVPVREGVKTNELSAELYPLNKIHASKSGVQRNSFFLLLIALTVILTSVLNYILISLSEMVHKAKTVAVMKCYGASTKNIYTKFIRSAALHLLGAFIVAGLLILSGVKIIEELIGTSVLSLFQGNSMLLLGIIFILILLITALIPASVYNKIPVAVAFRKFKENTHKWKHALLFIQFCASMLFTTLLFIVVLQYQMMTNSNPGYSYKNLVILPLWEAPYNLRGTFAGEIAKLQGVNSTARSAFLPYQESGIEKLSIPDREETLEVNNSYCVTSDYLKVLNIPIIEGRGFNDNMPGSNEVMVSRNCAEQLITMCSC